jgi:peptide/nickel transport system substrate-binding protein
MSFLRISWLQSAVFGATLALLCLSVYGQDKKPAKEEIEDPAKPVHKVIRVGDEEAESPKSEVGAASLEREAAAAGSVAVRELFAALAHPHDVVTLSGGTVLKVEPIPAYHPKGKLSLRPLDEKWAPKPTRAVTDQDVARIDRYEQLAVDRVEGLLKAEAAEATPGARKREALQAAQKVLAAVIRAHWVARQGEGWKPLEKQLQSKLQELRLRFLEALATEKQWEPAFALAGQLADDYRNDSAAQLQVARLLAGSVAQALDARDYPEARRRLAVLSERFGANKEFEPVRQQLRSRAGAIVEEAKKLEKEGKNEEAIARLQIAETVDPQLPELHDYRLRLARHYPILVVGVRELPRELSPARAVTDADKQAVELLFESLVRLESSPVHGERYIPELASDMPFMTPLGRQFHLIPNAHWSNGQQITAADVRHTVRLLSDRKWPGHDPSWGDFLEDGATIGADAFHITLTLRQGFIDPLALMSFKILPEQLPRADDAKFAHAPIGSGPFRFAEMRDGAAVFLANPAYERRSDKQALPHIREIHLVASKDPVADLQAGRVQLLVDVPSRRCKELESAGIRNVAVQTMRNQRVYFLAVNQRRPHLQNQALRRAIAHGIDRDAILTKCFRAGVMDRHHVLNGPFPARSWPVQPTLPAQPFNADLARAQAEKAKAEGAVAGRLTLRYPQGDPAVEEACQAIREQLISLSLGIELQLLPRSERDLHQDVEQSHDYDLAYYSWDFPDKMYWIWPMFDPRAVGPGGRNFLGYQNDDILESLLRRMQTHREFAVVQELGRRIHQVLYERMPLIPLWQLDTHVAVHNSLSIPGEFDPLLVFPGVENWTLAPR